MATEWEGAGERGEGEGGRESIASPTFFYQGTCCDQNRPGPRSSLEWPEIFFFFLKE